jgi:hypothetical protein
MSAVVDFVEDVVGGVVEAVGDVVESVVDVVQDVGRAIDDYVIQPILDDPLSAIATVAAASFLGPGAAAMFGTSASVGVGIAAGAANAAAGLVQGEDFGEAIKGGLMAGVGAGLGSEFLGGTGAEAGTPTPSTDVLGDFLAANNNFVDVPMDALAAAPSAVTSPVDVTSLAGTDVPLPSNVDVSAAAPTTTTATPSPLETVTATPDASAAASTTPSPLQSLNTNVPQVDMSAVSPVTTAPELPTFTSGLDTSFTPDYNLASGVKPSTGLQVPDFTPADSFDIYGNANYSLTPSGMSGGPGLQLPDAPNLARMGGGQGLTADVSGLPEFRYSDASLDPSIRGTTDTWTGDSGRTYGAATPDVTVSQTAITPTPQTITYDATTNMGTPSVLDQLSSGNLVDAAKTVGSNVVDWTKNANPWVLGAGALAATSALGGAGGPPSATPPPRGSTQDANFTKSLDLYQYMRDKANYGGDLAKYGQTGGEHQFFQNTKFVPVPIPGQEPKPAKMGGLIQMKHFAQGGMAQGMQGRPQMPPQGGMQGRPQMPQQGGRPPMMQGGAMPQRPMMPQNAQGQGMPPQGGMQQGRPQMPQRPRDPKTAYYQYGQVPTQAKAMGGLSQVHSMKIGGGADGRSDDVNAVLSDGEYVMDAETVAMLGNGSSKAGAAKLDQMRSKLRQHKGKNLASGKISPNAKSPLSYLRGA